MANTLLVNVKFNGGLEYLFDNKKSLEVPMPENSNILQLVEYLKTNELKERVELFVENGTVRPGILVFVNNVDWELLDEGNCKLKNGDEVVFISTLHGG